MNNKIMFLFGSGLSYATGMPNVNDITISILNDSWEKTNKNIYIPSTINKVLNIQNFAN